MMLLNPPATDFRLEADRDSLVYLAHHFINPMIDDMGPTPFLVTLLLKLATGLDDIAQMSEWIDKVTISLNPQQALALGFRV